MRVDRDGGAVSHLRGAVVLFLGVAALGGCSSSPPEAASDGAWGNATAVEELAIGVELGEDPYMFGAIVSVAAGLDGTIYVSDRQQVIVRAYDADGTYLRDIGRQGQGPGEYVTGPLLGILPDRTLVTRDQAGRVSYFSPEGAFLTSFSVVGFTGLVIDRDANVYVHRSEGDVRLVKYSFEGEELEEIAFPPRDMAGDQTFVLGFGEGGIRAFPTETHSAWSPLGYLVTGRNDVYAIELHDPEGTIHLRREIEPAGVHGDEQAQWEAFRQGLIVRVAERGDDVAFEPIPEVKPYFREIRVDNEGRIWVWRYVAAVERDDIEPLPDRPERPLLTWREPWTWDVFEPDGTFLGSVVVPETFRPYVFRGERIWGAIDRDGVEQVLRLRVVPEGS